jgi:hypothetical protein
VKTWKVVLPSSFTCFIFLVTFNLTLLLASMKQEFYPCLLFVLSLCTVTLVLAFKKLNLKLYESVYIVRSVGIIRSRLRPWSFFVYILRACGSVIGCEAESRKGVFQFPLRSLDFSIDLIPPALGLTQPVTKMRTSNLPVHKGWPTHWADNLITICEPFVYKMWEPRCLTTLQTSVTCY